MDDSHKNSLEAAKKASYYEMIELVDDNEKQVGKAKKDSAHKVKLGSTSTCAIKMSGWGARRLSAEGLFKKRVPSCQQIVNYQSDDLRDIVHIIIAYMLVKRGDLTVISARFCTLWILSPLRLTNSDRLWAGLLNIMVSFSTAQEKLFLSATPEFISC